MSKKLTLTTEQIIRHLTNASLPGDWEWEVALEGAVQHSWEDAADAARFLESLHPGRRWTAAQYNGLMYHHFTGRWSSVEEIAYQRAGEKYEDDADAAQGDPKRLHLAENRHTSRTLNDAAAVEFLRSVPGTHLFDCADGTVLAFDGIVNGFVKEEDPA